MYKYSKYLIDLRVNFDNTGELLTPVDGVGVSRVDVLLLDDTFPQDPWIEAQLEDSWCRFRSRFQILGLRGWLQG